MEPELEARRLLAEVAFLACVSNDALRARRIAGGLAAIAPGCPESVFACAIADLTAGQFDAAAERLRPLAGSGDAHALTFLALALKLGGHSGERDAVLARIPVGDPVIDALAATLR